MAALEESFAWGQRERDEAAEEEAAAQAAQWGAEAALEEAEQVGGGVYLFCVVPVPRHSRPSTTPHTTGGRSGHRRGRDGGGHARAGPGGVHGRDGGPCGGEGEGREGAGVHPRRQRCVNRCCLCICMFSLPCYISFLPSFLALLSPSSTPTTTTATTTTTDEATAAREEAQGALESMEAEARAAEEAAAGLLAEVEELRAAAEEENATIGQMRASWLHACASE